MSYEYERGLPLVLREWPGAAQSNETRLGYTTNGLLAAITNANGHSTRIEYESHGLPSRVIPGIGPEIEYTYTALGHLREMTLGGNRTVRYEPDELGRVRTVTYPDGTQARYDYDARDAVTNYVDALGRVTRLTYAPTRKLTGVYRTLEGATNQEVGVTYTYDNQFNTLDIRDELGRAVESYQLDLNDRVEAVTNLEGQVLKVAYGVGDFVKSVTRFDSLHRGRILTSNKALANRTFAIRGGKRLFSPSWQLKTPMKLVFSG